MRNLGDFLAAARIASLTVGFTALFALASYGADGSSQIPEPGPNAATLAREMTPGINLGNTMEAIPSQYNGTKRNSSAETAWGADVVNQAIFNAYAAAGFKSVRIPVSWTQYSDSGNTIAPFWMARVKQVVDYARKAGLYVVINVHWDGGWLNQATYAQQAANDAKLTKFWTQIATAFKDYDDHLLFAGTNEVGQDNTSGPPKAEHCAVQNGYNQAFVNTVRATGGNNASRYLVVQAYFTNIDNVTGCNAALPADTAIKRLAMEVHYYDPYDFALNDKSKIWQWGKNATDPSATETWANESWVDARFQILKANLVDKGVPVLLGEYGAYLKPGYPGMNAYRKDWIQYITHSSSAHGVVPMWWDTGELFDRSTGRQKLPETIGWIVNSAK